MASDHQNFDVVIECRWFLTGVGERAALAKFSDDGMQFVIGPAVGFLPLVVLRNGYCANHLSRAAAKRTNGVIPLPLGGALSVRRFCAF